MILSGAGILRLTPVTTPRETNDPRSMVNYGPPPIAIILIKIKSTTWVVRLSTNGKSPGHRRVRRAHRLINKSSKMRTAYAYKATARNRPRYCHYSQAGLILPGPEMNAIDEGAIDLT